jgi:hypothetical protein
MFSKVIIWGYPLYTHTHSYIHYGWYKAFKHMGYDTFWFHDNEFPVDFDYNNCLFISQGYADNNIPIIESSIYFIHIAINPLRYISKVKRFIEIRYLVDNIIDYNYRYRLDRSKCKMISNCTYYEKLHNNGGLAKSYTNPEPMEYECIYTCWATDLLPKEILESNIYIEKHDKIYWFGSANHNNTYEIKKFYTECINNKIEFITNDPLKNPLSFDKFKYMMMISYMSPDIRSGGDLNKIAMGENGSCHKKIGYIASNIFKAISYGCLAITNSRHTYNLLEQTPIYNDDESQLFYDAKSQLSNYELIKKQMNIVREKHTYINRIEDLLNVLTIKI